MNDAPTPEVDIAPDAENALSPLDAAYAEIELLKNQLANAQSASGNAKDALLRAEADAQNRIRRAENEATKAKKFAAEDVLKDFLNVADSLELGIKAASNSQDAAALKLLEGMQLTFKQMLSALERNGVKAVDPTGQPVNADLHQVMSMMPSAEVPANHVISVMQKGYTLNERLLRPALVIVAQAAE